MSEAAGDKTIAQRLGPIHAGLRADLEVTRHQFRGCPQYVVRDPLTFQTHQFSRSDYQIVVSINDSESLAEIFERLVDDGRLKGEQEDEFYQFILGLYRLNYLILPMADGKVLYQRFASRQRAARWRQVGSFLFLRVPLVNPDAFLDRTAGLLRPLFTRTALVVWLLMMATGIGILIRRWDAFKDPSHSILANETLLFLWFALIFLKVFHEFGHAFACKIFGGKVPEMGAYFIAFTPCAYMDASAAWGFSRTRHRVIVSLAGMYFESVIAFAAVLVWCWTDDPLISSCAHHVVVLSSAVTIGFNINPLMRYDGYYVLSDLTGIPNLRQRSIEQIKSVAKRWLLGITPQAAVPPLRERAILMTYGVASAIYKVTLVLAICTMIAMKFYLVGLGMAAFFLFSVLSSFLRHTLSYLWRSQETRPVRYRAVALSLILLVLIPAGIATIPVPGRVVVPGVVQTRDDAKVFAQVDGILQPSPLTLGSRVDTGETLCQLQNVETESAVDASHAEAEVARMSYAQSIRATPQWATAARVRWEQATQRLERATQRRGQLRVVAPLAGSVTQILDLRDTGRYLSKGAPVATVSAGPWVVRCLATAEEMADVHPQQGQQVRVRVQTEGVQEMSGTVEKVAVKGSCKIPYPSLTQLGGGKIAVDPATMVTNRPMFEIVIRLREAEQVPLHHDGYATVLFPGRAQTYGAYAYRRFQQFLNRLRVR